MTNRVSYVHLALALVPSVVSVVGGCGRVADQPALHSGGGGGSAGIFGMAGTSETGGTSGAAGTAELSGASGLGGSAGAAEAAGANGIGGAGAAGAAGAAGVGAAGTPGCSLRVPGDFDSLAQAVENSPVPGVVCVDPGTYLGLNLRDGVDIFGTAPGVVLCGEVRGSFGPPAFSATVENVDLPYGLTVDNFVRLTLRHVRVGASFGAVGCRGTEPQIQVSSRLSSDMTFTVEDVQVQAPGIRIDRTWYGSSSVHDRINVTRSRCVDPHQCWDFVHFTLDGDGNAIPATNALDVDISNNLIPNTVLEGIAFNSSLTLPDAVLANSKLWIRNNTIGSAGDSNYGIVFWSSTFSSVVIANNAVSYLTHPVQAGSAAAVLTSNALGNAADSKAWFVNFDGADFHPAPGSTLLGAADPGYAPSVDIDGNERVAPFDIGAYASTH